MNAAGLLLLAALSLPGQFDFGDEDALELAGNVKAFTIASIPYEHSLLPDDPTILGLVAARVKMEQRSGEYARFEFHPVFVASSGGGGLGGGFGQTGVAQARPEAIDLSFDLANSGLGAAQFLIDRGSVKLTIPHLDLTLGRQPISFGQGFFFTPMDLVTAFNPATLDREYKPGVDAVRADVFIGTATRFTLVAAYGGAWDLEGSIFAGHARFNLIGVDLGLFASWNRGDAVGGFELATDLLGLGVFGEATATYPLAEGDDTEPYLRAVVGAQTILPNNVSLLVELYAQSVGAPAPDKYLALATDKRFGRGELSLLGRLYAAASLGFEISPLLRPGFFALANLEDGSMLVGPSLSWSISEQMDLAVGGQVTLGERPGEIDPLAVLAGAPPVLPVKSEFGLFPTILTAQLSGFF